MNKSTPRDDAFALWVFLVATLQDKGLSISCKARADQHTVFVTDGTSRIAVLCKDRFEISVETAPSLSGAMPLHELVKQAVLSACRPGAILEGREILDWEAVREG